MTSTSLKRWRGSRRVIASLAAALALAGSAVASTPARAQTPSSAHDRWSGVRATIRDVMRESSLASITVAVAKDGKIVWEEGFGWADREKMLPATPQTMYSLASISKPFSATGLMTLVEQGKIDLDKPANDYLGTGKLTGLAGDASAATVRRVMSHTSGLPLHYQFYYSDNAYPVVSNDETIARYGILVTPPGEVYEYSNLGYGIVDHIIARASKSDYADFMRAKVFLPLGLTHTSVGIGPGMESWAAQRYDANHRVIPFYDFDHRGGSAIYSSAHDLIRFGMFSLKNHLADAAAILKDETIDQMQRPVAPAAYGLGWIVTDDDLGFRRIAHTGGMPGVRTILYMYPSENLAVVVLTNSETNSIGRVAGEITSVMLPRYATGWRELLARRQRAAPAPKPVPFAPSPELLGEWSGTLRTWERTIPLTLVIQPDGDVHVRMEGGLETILDGPTWQDNNLTGRFAGTIPTPDAARWPHTVLLDLRLRNGTLSGAASALQEVEPVYFALSSYVTLTRKPGAK